MGLILDASFLIEKERRRESPTDILRGIRAGRENGDAGISAVTAVELTHGIHRARSDGQRARRRAFADELFKMVVVTR